MYDSSYISSARYSTQKEWAGNNGNDQDPIRSTLIEGIYCIVSSISFLTIMCCCAGVKNSAFKIALETMMVVAGFAALTCI